MHNPLLSLEGLPQFGNILPEHVIPALQQVLSENREKIDQLSGLAQADWHNFALIMENLDERVSRVWSPIGHLNAVQDSAPLRKAYQEGIALLSAYHSELGQHQGLFQQYRKMKIAPEFGNLSAAQRKVIDNALLEFKRSGAELANSDQITLRDLNLQLSELSNQFEQNVLDATQAWSTLITDPALLKGLPDSALEMAQQAAAESEPKGSKGWLFNLQFPSYYAVMQYAENASLRETLYRAYVTRASEYSDSSQFDNEKLIQQILQLRTAKARLLSYAHYAEYSLEQKMAESEQQVEEFLLELVHHAQPVAQKELEQLQQFALEQFACAKMQPWDIAYFSEQLRQHQYAFNDEQVKPYFPASQALSGLFQIVEKLFLIEIKENLDMPIWHSDVRCFDVIDIDSGQTLGSLYTDLYVRQAKRGGAWMDSCIHRRRLSTGVQKPVAYLTCNFTPPIGEKPALLSHSEVETLFHEFGHTLHHLLTQVDEMSVSGINGVSWDAVELPSQFLENWCWQDESLAMIASHYQSGESLPAELLEKMRAARNFQSGMQTLRQVEFALFDMRLHQHLNLPDDPLNVQDELDRVRKQVAVLQPPEYNRFQNSFGHIFAGGYAAGYYSYKWSEVLSADAFSKFEEDGLFNQDTGLKFKRCILERGGVDDANDLFIEFRGRAPSITPLLQHTGILR